MAILIDGYKLLHGTDLFGRGRDAGTLEASREALIGFVLASVDPRELSRTTIVFDSKAAPPGLPNEYHRPGGLTILYARDYADADELLEELIQRDHAPKKLTVVSSDHRVQRAADRRKALVRESREWYLDMRQRLSASRAAGRDAKSVEPIPGSVIAEWESDVNAMLAAEQDPAFQRTSERASDVQAPAPQSEDSAAAPPKKPQRRIRRRGRGSNKPDDAKELDLANPFPPGYAEDLLLGEEDV